MRTIKLWTKKETKNLLVLYKEGTTVPNIAALLDRTEISVRRKLTKVLPRSNSLKKSKPMKIWTLGEEKRLQGLLLHNASVIMISNILDRSYASVYAKIQELKKRQGQKPTQEITTTGNTIHHTIEEAVEKIKKERNIGGVPNQQFVESFTHDLIFHTQILNLIHAAWEKNQLRPEVTALTKTLMQKFPECYFKKYLGVYLNFLVQINPEYPKGNEQ